MIKYDWIVDKYQQALAADSNLPAKLSNWLAGHSGAGATNRTYDTEEGRLAYCLSHFAVGASTIENVLRTQSARRPFPHPYTFFCDDLSIVSLGSGPGSDLVGCLASLGAVPRRLKLYAADKEPGWGGWVKSAVDASIASDPLLTAASPTVNFQALDLDDNKSVKEYIDQFQHGGPTIFVMHRVLGSVVSPVDLSSILASESLPAEAMVIVVAPRHNGRHISRLSSLLEQNGKGWTTRQESGVIGHHGWIIPSDIWDALVHKPEVRAEYDAIVSMRDVVTTLRWPEIGLDSRRPQTSQKT